MKNVVVSGRLYQVEEGKFECFLREFIHFWPSIRPNCISRYTDDPGIPVIDITNLRLPEADLLLES